MSEGLDFTKRQYRELRALAREAHEEELRRALPATSKKVRALSSNDRGSPWSGSVVP